MSAAQTPPGERIFVGSFCQCVRQPLGPGQTHPAYALVSHVDQEIIGKLTWEGGTRRYVLETKPKSRWNSTALSEVALWMRKLSRQGLDVHMRTTGHLLVAVALAWLLLSTVTPLQCRDTVCTPTPDLPASMRTLGDYATEERCQDVRAEMEQRWRALEAEINHAAVAWPNRMVLQTTFTCTREGDTAPQVEGR